MEKYQSELRHFVDELYEGEKKVLVFGEGRRDAKVMMIGEAPGEQETLKGRPFVGKAGKNLDEFLAAARMALARPRWIWAPEWPPSKPRRDRE